MKIGKAPTLLKKAAGMCKSKTGMLAARLLVLGSFRRRMAMAGAISHKIHALMVAADRVMVGVDSFHKALVLPKAKKMPAIYGCEIVGDISHQFTRFDQEKNGDGGCPNWMLHPIINDDDNCSYIEEYEEDDDELSGMDVIWSNQDVEGLQFYMDDDIDQAAEVFIRRFREQMNKSI